MKVFLALSVLTMICFSRNVEASNERGRACIGHILYDGSFAQHCYSTSMKNDWEVVWVDEQPKGFEVISFTLQKEVCIRRRMNGKCWRFRYQTVKVIMYERKEMSLKKSVKILGLLSGLTRSKKIKTHYRLYKRSLRRGVRIELSEHSSHDRFLVGIQSRHNFKQEYKVAKKFLSELSTTITIPH